MFEVLGLLSGIMVRTVTVLFGDIVVVGCHGMKFRCWQSLQLVVIRVVNLVHNGVLGVVKPK